jgi:DNA-binding response OmpR family regulator
VDDNRSNIDILLEALEVNYEVFVALDGETALDIARAEQPDMILLDVMMPEMDGYQVICELKGDRKTVSIPVIFLTAKSQEEEIVKGFQLGAVDYIPKPFQREVLLARVRTHLNLKNYQDRIKRDHQRLKLRNLELEKDMSMARNLSR